MPPALIYRRHSDTIEEVPLKGLPLGSPQNGRYRKKAVPVSAGDVILLMSDGFPELFNGDREMLGYARARSELLQVGRQSPDEILEHFRSVCNEWIGTTARADDVTFVVIRVK